MASAGRSCGGSAVFVSHHRVRKAAQAGAAAGIGPAVRNRRDRKTEQLRARAENAKGELARSEAALDRATRMAIEVSVSP